MEVSLPQLLVQLLQGLASASGLFLVAAGLTVIFGVTRVVNFSHGSLYMLGAYLAFSILGALPRDPAWLVLGVLAAALATGAIGLVIEQLLLRRIYRAPELFQLLATFGVVLVMQDVVPAVWGSTDLTLPRPPWLRAGVDILGERFPLYDLILIGVGPLVLLALWLLFTRTRWGMLVRAATQDRDMVAALGVNQRVLFSTVFALGSALAGLGGALALPAGSANLQMDLAIIAEAFVVVVVGGMGSLPGAFLAALLIGVLQSLGILFVPQGALVLIFVVMAVVLALRPQGLLGRAQAPARGAGEAPLLLPAGRGLRIAGTALLAIAAAAPLVVPPYAVSVLTEMAVFALFAASLHLLMGPGGMISFGHAAWFGLGAYGAAIAVHALGVPMPAGLLLGLALAGATALLVGAFVVRLTGVYLAMLTMAFAQIAWAFVFLATELTGGDNGVLGVRPEPWARDPATFFWLALALAVAGVLALRALAWTPFGFALRAARDSELRAAAIGLPVARLRWTAFAIGGAAAGLAGALYAYSKGSVFPTYISIPKSVDALIMVLLGGVHTLSGPVIGAIAYTGLYDALLRATDLWRLALGLIIIALVLAFPDGLAGAARRLLPGRAH